MKGQIFVLFGILIAILIIYIGSIMHVNTNIDTLSISNSFLNLNQAFRDKMNEVVQAENPSRDLNEFLNLTKYVFISKGVDQRAMYCYVFNGTEFTISNFLGGNMTNITINFNGDIISLNSLEDGNSYSHKFAKSNSYNVKVNYFFNNSEKEIRFSGYSGIGSSDITLYYYIELSKNNEKYSNEDIIRKVIWK